MDGWQEERENYKINHEKGIMTIESSKSNLIAFIGEASGTVTYYLTGVYNTGNDLEEIDVDALENLKRFVDYIKE